MFRAWGEHPPTNILVKGLLLGLGAVPQTADKSSAQAEISQEAQTKMKQMATLTAIAAKAGTQMPVMRGRDPGLPAQAPNFDEAAMRLRNAEILARRVKMRRGIHV